MWKSITTIAIVLGFVVLFLGATPLLVAAQDETPTPEAGTAGASVATAEEPAEEPSDTDAIITPPEAEQAEAPAAEPVQGAAPEGGTEAPAAPVSGTEATGGGQPQAVPSVGVGFAVAEAARAQSLPLVALFGLLAIGSAWASRRLASYM